MRDFLAQIEAALDANLYYLALFAALTVPDICGAIESTDGLSTGKKYIQWFEKHIAPQYTSGDTKFLTGEDCYNFRCSLLHQGTSQHPKSSYSRVVFVEPKAGAPVFHCNIIDDALNIDVSRFCRDLVTAAIEWMADFHDEAQFQRNLNKFMRRYPDGLPPYIVGVPVIS